MTESLYRTYLADDMHTARMQRPAGDDWQPGRGLY